jgi:hypothetical protein
MEMIMAQWFGPLAVGLCLLRFGFLLAAIWSRNTMPA